MALVPGKILAVASEDSALLDRYFTSLKKQLADIGYTNPWQRFTAKEVKWAELRNAWQSMSFFGGEVYCISGCEIWKKEAWEEISWVIEHADSPHFLVLVASSFDQRLQAVKKLKAAGQLTVLEIPNRGAWGAWVAEVAKREFGLALAPAAVRALGDAVGEAPWQVVGALEQLSLFFGAEIPSKIDEKIITHCFGYGSQDDIFAFTKMVATRNKREALARIAAMLEQGMEPLYILAMLRRHYKILLTLSGLGSRLPPAEKAKLAGAPPYFLGEYESQLKGYRRQALVALYHGLACIDQRLKSEKTPALMMYSDWIMAATAK